MGRTNDPWELERVPERLPLLPLYNEVLLPTSVAQVHLSSKSKLSAALIEHLSSEESKESYLAVVPVITDSLDQEIENLDSLHPIGTAARVLQLSSTPQTDDFTLVVEGRARILVSTPKVELFGNCHTVSVELPNTSKPHRLTAPRFILGNHHNEKEENLGGELIGRCKALLGLLVQQTGASAAARLLEALEAMPPWHAADVVAAILTTGFQERISMLDAVEHGARIRLALTLVKRATHTVKKALAVRKEMDSKGVRTLMAPSGVKIRRSMDIENDAMDDIADLMDRLKKAGPPPQVLRVAQREAKRLQRTSEQNPSYAMSRGFLEILADLPWGKVSPPPSHSLKHTRHLLNNAHYGLDRIKDRIVQYGAVQRLKGPDTRAPILCFVGPPGVGKTSLAKCVAEVLQRPFVRISLGGVRDEAEIRGHRKTYVGAMPGRVINGLRRVGTRDPVMLLDELDKMGHDIRGDPASALLEVLDPEQNPNFVDTYLGLPFDLSRVVFLGTANRLSGIPPPLLDRLEVIELPGYTLHEKIRIAQRHLLPKVLKEHGLGGVDQEGVLFAEDVLECVIQGYTREAGVRGLERCLAAICRHCVTGIVMARESANEAHHKCEDSEQTSSSCDHGSLDEDTLKMWETEWKMVHKHAPYLSHPPNNISYPTTKHLASLGNAQLILPRLIQTVTANEPQVTPLPPKVVETSHHNDAEIHPPINVDVALVEKVLGPPKFSGPEAIERISGPGVAAGLVWTPVGGMVQYIECCCTSLSETVGQLKLTGQVGDVLEESAAIALSWIRSHMDDLGVKQVGGKNEEARRPFEEATGSSRSVGEVRRPTEEVTGSFGEVKRSFEEASGSFGEGSGSFEEASGSFEEATGSFGGVNGSFGSFGEARMPTEEVTGSFEEPSGSFEEGSGSDKDALVMCHGPNARMTVSHHHHRDLNPAMHWNVHIHLPAGAIPKDGPSAGITMAVALISLFSGRTVRPDTAMTGELTLRGIVLPVGGIKEKLLAAHRAGVKQVIVPMRNLRDVQVDVPKEVREGLEIKGVQKLEDVLLAAFDPPYIMAPRSKL